MSDYISVIKHVWIEADNDAHFLQREVISEKFL